MAGQNLTELCTILIENHLGDLSAQIFATLAEHGRQAATTLALHAQIPFRRVQTGLAALMEEQLVMHHTAEEGLPTYYAVNWRNAYNLARHTNIIQLVTDRHGETAGQIVKNILQLGHARVGDLAEAYELEVGSKRDSGIDTTANHVSEEGMINGIAKPVARPAVQHVQSAAEFHSVLNTLLKSGILVKVGMRAFVPPSDLQEQIEEAVISEHFPDRKVTGPMKAKKFAAAVGKLKRQWQEDDKFSAATDYASKGAIKRPVDHFQGANKRVKMNGDLPNGHAPGGESAGPKLSFDLIVRVDFVRCAIALRSSRLEELAKHSLGPAVGAVYSALLRALERKMRGLRDDLDCDEDQVFQPPVATLKEIADELDPSVDLSMTIQGVGTSKHLPNGVSKKRKKNHVFDPEADIKHEDVDSDGEAPNGFTDYNDRSRYMKHIEAHLMLLQEHNMQFCRRAGQGIKSQQWLVDSPALTDSLIDAELDSTVLDRHGRVALRIVRMLREKGKLDEKQVAALAMMRMRDVRNVLVELQFAHYIEAQELPKDARRQPSNTLYYWYFDTPRVANLVLQQTYKTMSRTLQRIPVERESYRTVIEKAERTDVKGHEEVKLGAEERQALRRWREIEERMLTQVARLDDTVAILRDFQGTDTEMAT